MTLPEFEALLHARDLHPSATASGFTAHCPAHEDNSPSLSVGTGNDGRILLNCHAGCASEAVVAALGLKMRDLFPPGTSPATTRTQYVMTRGNHTTIGFPDGTARGSTTPRRPAAAPRPPLRQVDVYPYTDRDGVMVFEVVRYEPKTFRQRVPDPTAQGGYTYSTTSVPDKPIYRLPYVLAAIEGMTTVFVVEGEKDVEALQTLGLVATCNPGGAGKFTESQAESMRGASVIIFADKDAPGAAHAEDVAEKLGVAGATVLGIFTFPDVSGRPVKDAADFVEAGGTAQDILAIINARPAAPPPAPHANGINGHAAPPAAGLPPVFTPNEPQIRADLLAAIADIQNDPLLAKMAARRNVLIAEAVVAALHLLGQFYYNAEMPSELGCMYFNRAKKNLLPITADMFTFWLSVWAGVTRASSTWDVVFKEVANNALVGPQTQPVTPETYWARRIDPVTNAMTVYVSNGDGGICRIDAGGLSLVDNGADGVLFAAGKTLRPWKLVPPVDPFTTCRVFSDMKATDPHGLLLAKLWVYSMPTAASTKPPALFTGDVGSGKTRSAKGIAELYGIPEIIQKVQAEKEDDFWVAANSGGLLIMDNADTRTKWLPDALAASATGGTVSRRVLYTNSDTMLLRAKSWVIVTSANPSFASDAGLADRLAVVRMGRNDKETEDEGLSREIVAARNAGLSHIVTTLQTALSDTTPIPPGLNYRFPDFGRLAYRIGKALGLDSETVAALAAAEADKVAICIENDPVLTALVDYIRHAGPFVGTAKELGTQLSVFEPDISDLCSPKKLGKRLRNHWSHIKAVFSANYEEPKNTSAIFSLRMKGA